MLHIWECKRNEKEKTLLLGASIPVRRTGGNACYIIKGQEGGSERGGRAEGGAGASWFGGGRAPQQAEGQGASGDPRNPGCLERAGQSLRSEP